MASKGPSQGPLTTTATRRRTNLSGNNDEERIARIEAILEEYRVRHEDFQAYVRSVNAAAHEILERTRLTRAQIGKSTTKR